MKNDERQRTDRRLNEQWARRMRALEREFERADRARPSRVERVSVPMALLAGGVVLLVAVLILVATRSGGRASDTPPARTGPPDAFAATPAELWLPAAQGISLPSDQSDSSVQAALVHARDYLVATHAGNAILAPGNTLLMPVRANGTVRYTVVAASGKSSAVDVAANVIWAYAMHADYPRADGDTTVVAVHERVVLRYPIGSAAGQARPHVVSDASLWFDADCGYLLAGRVGLPRADDPDALPGYGNGVSVQEAFALGTTVQLSGHVCTG